MSVAAVLALAVLWPAPAAAQGGERAAQSAYELGIRLEQEGRAEEALAAFSTVLRLNPKSTGALRRRAALLLRLERLEEAEADVTRLLEANLSDPEGIRLRGELRLRRGDFQGALEAFDQCLKLGHETSAVQRG
ncbi:MAG: tetratricopeptide repeat protein, partial [Bryobacteraceae bacterium]